MSSEAEVKARLEEALQRQARTETARQMAEGIGSTFTLSQSLAVHESGHVVAGSMSGIVDTIFVHSLEDDDKGEIAQTLYFGAENTNVQDQLNQATTTTGGPAFDAAYATIGDAELAAKLLFEPSAMLALSVERGHGRYDVEELKEIDCTPADILGNLRFNFLLARFAMRHDMLLPFADRVREPIAEGKAAAIDVLAVRIAFAPVINMAVQLCSSPQLWKGLADARGMLAAVEDVAPTDGYEDVGTWMQN